MARLASSKQSASAASLLLIAALACNSPAPDPTSGGETGDETTAAGSHGSTTTVSAETTGDAPTSSTSSSSSTSPSTSSDPQTTTGTDSVTATTAGETSGTSGDTGTTTTGSSGTTGVDTTGTTGADTTGTTGADTTGTTGTPDELGELSGDCGLIDAMELDSPSPYIFTSAIDFGVIGYDYDLLTDGGKQIYDEGNLNPGSLYSEIVAYEVLARCEMAALLKTEAKIVYTDPMGKKTDLLVDIDGFKVGVSVVRAVGFPQDDPYTPAQAQTILQKKLDDILISSANVAPEDAWIKQILHVVAYGPMHLDSILTAYEGLAPQTKADTILFVTVTDGDDAFIY